MRSTNTAAARLTRIAIALIFSCSGASLAAEPGGVAERGAASFLRAGCWECHGTRGAGGGDAGPSIAPNPPPVEALLAQIRHPARNMPAYSPSLLNDEDIRDIYAFLKSIGPGRPVGDIPALNH